MRTTSEANKTAVAELRGARFLLATGPLYCTEALCHTFAFTCCCCSSWFWSYHFYYIRYQIWSLTFQRERICWWSHEFASGKNLTTKLRKCTKKLTSGPAVYDCLFLGWFRICRDVWCSRYSSNSSCHPLILRVVLLLFLQLLSVLGSSSNISSLQNA